MTILTSSLIIHPSNSLNCCQSVQLQRDWVPGLEEAPEGETDKATGSGPQQRPAWVKSCTDPMEEEPQAELLLLVQTVIAGPPWAFSSSSNDALPQYFQKGTEEAPRGCFLSVHPCLMPCHQHLLKKKKVNDCLCQSFSICQVPWKETTTTTNVLKIY